MPDQPRIELADYLVTAEIDTHILVQEEDSVRADWWRASCAIHDWYAIGSKPNVEDAAAHHVAWDHPACAAPSDRTFIDTPVYCRLLPDHDDDHANGGYTWPKQPAPGPERATPHRERYLCPISTCSWVYDAPPAPNLDPAVLAHIFGPGAMTLKAVNQHHSEIERELKNHFSKHATAEYVAEIHALKNLNIGLIQQMQQLSEVLRDLMKTSPELRRDVDPAVQLSAAVGPGVFGMITGL